MRTMEKLAAFFALTALAGCASMQPQGGFDDVQQAVSERTGARVHWNNGTEADAEVKAAVGSLLQRELTVEDAVQLALLNNHNLQAIYEELNIAQADLVQAGLLRNPVFGGSVGFAISGGGIAPTLNIAQDFVGMLSMPLRKGRAEAAFERAKVLVTSAVLDAAFDVRRAFYDYQAAQQTCEMRATVVEATKASYELAKRLRAAGNFRELDLSNERALYERSKVELAAMETEVILGRERMNALMGLWGAQTQWRTSARLPAPPDDAGAPDGLERRAIAASLDLTVLRRDAEIAARSAGIARQFGWFTEAEVGVSAARELGEPWTVGPSLALPIPIFDQGQAKIASTDAQFRQAGERYIARAVEIRSRVRAAHVASVMALDRAKYYENVILPLRQKIVGETQLQYNAMQVSAFQLLQAKRDQIDAGAAYIGSLRDFWVAESMMDQILSGGTSVMDRTGGATRLVSAAPGSSGDGEHP